MATSAIAKAKDWKTRLPLAAPGLAARFRYEGSNLSHDVVAGLPWKKTQKEPFLVPTEREKEYSRNCDWFLL